ncbi:MAG: TraB/GumN family protein [Chthoniobacterales bacterium]
MKSNSTLKNRLLSFLGLAVLFLSGGCSSLAPQPTGKSTLWRVQSPTNTVYLMGSIHVLPKSVYPLKPALCHAFNDSQRVIFEIALGDEKHDNAMADSFKDGLYPKGEKLSQHLSLETLTMLKTLLPYFGIPLEKLEPMRPWLVSDLMMSLYLERNGYDSERGLDFHFFKLAQKRGKPTGGLEKVQAQTAPFRQFSDVEADRYLRSTLGSLPFTGVWFGQMIHAWQTGDTAALDALINHSTKDEKGFYKSIFDDRNNAWMPAIRRTIGGKGNVLIIVGSGHLVGRSGIVRQLRSEGYSVEQL